MVLTTKLSKKLRLTYLYTNINFQILPTKFSYIKLLALINTPASVSTIVGDGSHIQSQLLLGTYTVPHHHHVDLVTHSDSQT